MPLHPEEQCLFSDLTWQEEASEDHSGMETTGEMVRWLGILGAFERHEGISPVRSGQLRDFMKAHGIVDEPAFSWWVPYMLQKRDVIISKVKFQIRKATHKYGIEMATSVDHAYEIDKGNGNTLWRDAIKKEMTNVGISFEVLEEGEKAPIAWCKVSGHLVSM